jgi:asparagine synthase (glutamine-hydrolysing)
MCGIAGYLGAGSGRPAAMQVLRAMATALVHRGPDDAGYWADSEGGMGLAHRRLSIIDLSPAGHQPMESACGRYVMAFNGEIYNFREIRAELNDLMAAPRWRGHSDTEVVLAAASRWGFAETLGKLTGMFAIALWDKQNRALYLARDRMGEKPLYYGWFGNVLLFGSELKALRAHPEWHGEINRNSLALYTRHSYVPAPHSIYKGVYKLPPGTHLCLETLKSVSAQKIASPVPYWSMKEVSESATGAPWRLSESEAIDELDALLKSTIARQMLADVPVGAFLSGGIDSSTVVALMQSQSTRPVKTFTIGFSEAEYNEAQHAKLVAAHLGTEHTELYVSPADAMSVIPLLPSLYDEPFSDSSQIPTFLVAKLARAHVTVSLSGDGGDELFGGYNRYFWAMDIWNSIRWLPRPLRLAASAAMTSISPHRWDSLFSSISPLLPKNRRQRMPGDKIHKLANVFSVQNPEEMYLGFVSHWERPEDLVSGATEPTTVLTDPFACAHLLGFAERMMYLDSVTYLPDDILVKVDRAAMGVSLETRVPLLDHNVVEFAWKLPTNMKIRNGGKWILRELLNRYIPRRLIDRPKMGFGVPIDSWLRHDLRDWAEDLLSESALRSDGYFDPSPIRKKWREHLSGVRNWQYHLWDILMFQAWLAEQAKHTPTEALVASA